MQHEQIHHIPEYLAPAPTFSPLREDDARVALGIDVEKNGSAVRPEVSTEAKVTTSSAKVTAKDKGKTRSSNIICNKAQDINSLASIEECLELHFEAEMVELTCENCSKFAQKLNKSVIQTRLSLLPPVLVIHLKRSLLQSDKVKGHVSFKEILDVGLFMDPRY